MTPMESTLLNILVVVASGATSVLVALVFRRLGDVAQDVKEIRADVGKHTADLAKGEARMDEIGRRLDKIEGRTEQIQSHGCARRCALAQDP